MDSRAWDERYAGAELVWSATPNQFVERELADLSPGTVVDLAAGEGRNALWLAARGWKVTAVDFSQVALDKAAQLTGAFDLPHPVTWVCADVLTWQPPGPVDLVVVAYLQLAPPERRTAVRSAFSMLCSGGTLLLVAHDSSNLERGTGGPQQPAVLLTADDVIADLDGISFDVELAGTVPRVVPAADCGPDQTAYDALVRLVRR